MASQESSGGPEFSVGPPEASGLSEMTEQPETMDPDGVIGDKPTELSVKVLRNLLEAELRCAVCQQLICRAVNLNCSHTFCSNCFNQWRRENNRCPACRSPFTNKTRVLAIDNLVTQYCQLANITKKETIPTPVSSVASSTTVNWGAEVTDEDLSEVHPFGSWSDVTSNISRPLIIIESDNESGEDADGEEMEDDFEILRQERLLSLRPRFRRNVEQLGPQEGSKGGRSNRRRRRNRNRNKSSKKPYEREQTESMMIPSSSITASTSSGVGSMVKASTSTASNHENLVIRNGNRSRRRKRRRRRRTNNN